MRRNINVFVLTLGAFFLCGIFLVFVFAPYTVVAQEEDLAIGISPLYPKPHESVTVTLESFVIDLVRSRIAWSVNGISQKSGFGERSLVFVTGGTGNVSRIAVSIQTPDGESITRTISIRPQEIDVLWQAHSYTPPFYKGKALPPSEGVVVVSAAPRLFSVSGSAINPNSLLYAWQQDGSTLGSFSGIGKKSIVLKNKPRVNDVTTITVTVSSPDGEVRSEGSVSIQTEETVALFYKKHPLEGVLYGQAVPRSFFVGVEETILRAEPYFFSLNDLADGNLAYKWSLNNENILGETQEVVLRNESGTRGTTRIQFQVVNLRSALQEVFATLVVRLGEQE